MTLAVLPREIALSLVSLQKALKSLRNTPEHMVSLGLAPKLALVAAKHHHRVHTYYKLLISGLLSTDLPEALYPISAVQYRGA